MDLRLYSNTLTRTSLASPHSLRHSPILPLRCLSTSNSGHHEHDTGNPVSGSEHSCAVLPAASSFSLLLRLRAAAPAHPLSFFSFCYGQSAAVWSPCTQSCMVTVSNGDPRSLRYYTWRIFSFLQKQFKYFTGSLDSRVFCTSLATYL